MPPLPHAACRLLDSRPTHHDIRPPRLPPSPRPLYRGDGDSLPTLFIIVSRTAAAGRPLPQSAATVTINVTRFVTHHYHYMTHYHWRWHWNM